MTWWNEVKCGDTVYVKTDRAATSGQGEVYRVGRKYFDVWVKGRSVEVNKKTGCTTTYPSFPVSRNKAEHDHMCALRQRIREASDVLNTMARDSTLRPDEDFLNNLSKLLDAKLA